MRQLSPRELQVLKLLPLPYKVIARELNCSENTVKVHVKRINLKLDCDNRAQSVVCALRLGVVKLEELQS